MSVGSLYAVLPNGGFETGDFSNWEKLGRTFIETTDTYGINPQEGKYQVRLDTVYPRPNGVSNSGQTGNFAEVLDFIGVEGDPLLSLGNGEVFEGSAIKTTLTAVAGDILSFDWNFLSNANSQGFFNDFAFVAISDNFEELADTFSVLVPSESVFISETGFKSFSYQFPSAGSYTLRIGVVDVGDGAEDSGLLVDRVSLFRINPVRQQLPPPSFPPGSDYNSIPEPNSIASLLALAVGGAVWRLWHQLCKHD
ncbi:MAG: hypothetical protein F6K36_15980 [Symploca sp. SIO3C6]|nr:hypothetical protein [Symploca sp. SIO3C6]NET05866.1 hypothetical protein [Symploca sp. SIO2B6]NET51549.1 hypothetical protein [Merismopedia sp. SIO2A8]